MAKSSKDLKKLIEDNKGLKAKLNALNVKVDDFIASSDETKAKTLNEAYAEFKAKQDQLPDVPPPVVVEPPVVEPPVVVVPPTPTPDVPPLPPTGNVIYDSQINSKLHDGIVRTVEKEGSISAGGLGVECHASGNPRIVVNNDGTFSLLCDAGHGRFYGYALNYNTTLEIECAFWNATPGQDLSLKVRSRHNEGGAETSRFGGYGLSIDRDGWGAKREPFHNTHDQATSGSLPSKPETQKYFTIEFTVKDEEGKVSQIAKMNGKQFMSKTDSSPESYMVDAASFAKQSYFWVRSNIDSGTGEIRIKRLRVLNL